MKQLDPENSEKQPEFSKDNQINRFDKTDQKIVNFSLINQDHMII